MVKIVGGSHSPITTFSFSGKHACIFLFGWWVFDIVSHVAQASLNSL